MKQVFNCTRENPLYQQLSEPDSHVIEEIGKM